MRTTVGSLVQEEIDTPCLLTVQRLTRPVIGDAPGSPAIFKVSTRRKRAFVASGSLAARKVSSGKNCTFVFSNNSAATRTFRDAGSVQPPAALPFASSVWERTELSSPQAALPPERSVEERTAAPGSPTTLQLMRPAFGHVGAVPAMAALPSERSVLGGTAPPDSPTVWRQFQFDIFSSKASQLILDTVKLIKFLSVNLVFQSLGIALSIVPLRLINGPSCLNTIVYVTVICPQQVHCLISR